VEPALFSDEIASALGTRRLHVCYLTYEELKTPIESIARRVKAVAELYGEAPVVFVDYMQMLATADPDGRRTAVGDLANRLRGLAQVIDRPVVCVSSTGRAFYGPSAAKAKSPDGEVDDNPLAWLAAGKESGDIEFAAGVFAYVELNKDADMFGWQAVRLILAKVRRGRVGFVGLKFHGATGAFVADDASLQVMGSKAKASARNDADDAAIIEALHDGKITSARRLESKSSEHHNGHDLPQTRAREAIKRLKNRGVIVTTTISERNARGQERVNSEALVLAGTLPARAVQP
jgi:hypothetical protein